jgi:hypothetical protein
VSKPKGSIKTALMEIIRNPATPARDRIAASDRLQRIRKQEPRGRQFKRSTPANALQPEPIRPQTESEKQLSQASTEPFWEEENRLLQTLHIEALLTAMDSHWQEARQELERDIKAGDPLAIAVKAASDAIDEIPYIHGSNQPERDKLVVARRAVMRDYRAGKPLNYRWWTEDF